MLSCLTMCMALGQIIAYYKYETTKRINKLLDFGMQKIWQRNYYERVIRDDAELRAISEYIQNNPYAWASERELTGQFPLNLKSAR